MWRSGGEVRYAVTQFRDRGIPASAFVFDSPWEIAYNDFQFNMTQFGQDATIEGTHYPGFASLVGDDAVPAWQRPEGHLLDGPVRQRQLR